MPRLLQTEKKQSASYPRGVCPAARRFAASMQLALLERALAPWPRRQTPLLEVNCGNGAFLQFLWQCGFDVQGVEADPVLREKAQKRPVPGLEVYAGHDASLPFENDSFDWLIMHLRRSRKEDIDQCLNEGARLARRGMMLTFWNNASLPAFCWNLFHKKPWAANGVAWWLVWRQMSKLGGRLSTVSTLAAPVCAWSRQWNPGGNMAGFPFGAWCVIRLDFGTTTPLTPLPLRLSAGIPQSLMEYAPKSTSTSCNKANSR